MKDTFFFPHDFGARNDPKLQNVLMEHGCEGLGVFWCVIEQIYEQGGSLPLSNCKSIAFALHVECSVVVSVVNDFDLFNNDGKVFWSESIKCRLNKRAEISEKRREAGKRGWQKTFGNYQPKDEQVIDNIESNANQNNNNKTANADYNNSICLTIKKKEIKEKEIKEKEIKEKENKEKENKENTSLNKEDKKAETAKRFTPPSIDEVQSYISEKNYSVDAESFVAFYQSKNWFVGKNKMKDWHAAVVTWEKRNKEFPAKKQSTTKNVNDIWGNQ